MKPGYDTSTEVWSAAPHEMDSHPKTLTRPADTLSHSRGRGTSFAGGRLSVETVERLHRLLGGDARVEGMILRFIADRYGAAKLLHLPPHVAKEIVKRPADFIRAAKNHCEPELNF